MKPFLYMVSRRLDPPGGLERVLIELARELSSTYQIEMLVLGRTDELGPALSSEPYTVISGLSAWWRVQQLLRRPTKEPIILCGLWAAARGFCVGPIKAQTLIHWEHSMLPQRVAAEKKLRLVRRMAKRNVGQANCIVCVSGGVASEAVEWLPEVPTVVIPNLVQLTERPFTPSNDELDSSGSAPVHLVGVGALRSVKNWSLAIEAMTRLPNSHRLTLVGDGPCRVELEETARRLGVADRLTFAGQVNCVEKFLLDADVLVHPSRSETFGLSVLEAAAVDLPVVTLDVQALDEVVPSLAVGIRSVESAEAFALAIDKAILMRTTEPNAFHTARDQRTQQLDTGRTTLRWVELLGTL